MGVFQGTQKRVRNSRGEGAISVRSTEVLLYAFRNMWQFAEESSHASSTILQQLYQGLSASMRR